ncbi:ankyrin repeat-containing domain protein [Aspergillus alliaceus]|uniref:Ankyrin repeat-containing domain protein n=1 Tax=Petromyces alliaceus TaxID=209559 RepID=A0A5N7CQ87_PETAA|nr:ankyrin repeat-containing domain protein [Aspergillus alliaceus]
MALIQMLAPIMVTTRACVINMLLANESIGVNIANDQGDYPLHVIPFDESYALTLLSNLYEKGADRSSLNQAHQTCLYLASKARNLEVVRRLMDEKDSDVRLLDNSDLSPIHHAVRRGHLDGVRFMFERCEREHPQTWHLPDHFGKSLLPHVESDFPFMEIIEFLLQCGCKVDHP